MDREMYPKIPYFISNEEHKGSASLSSSYELNASGSFGSIFSAPTVMQPQPQSIVSSPLSIKSSLSIRPAPSFNTVISPSSSCSTSDNNSISKNSFFTSSKLRRLEELKQYQKRQHNLFHPQCQEPSALCSTPTQSLSTSPLSLSQPYSRTPPSSPKLSPLGLPYQRSPSQSSSISSTQLSPPRSPLSWLVTQGRRNDTRESSTLQSPSLTPVPVPTTSQLSRPLTSYETTGYKFMEETLLRFIQNSSFRMTSSILFLMTTLWCLLSTDYISTNNFDMNDFAGVSMTTWWYHRVVKIIGVYCTEIFVTNMKLFVFAKLYGLTLDIILISAFDNVDIPMIVNRNINKQQWHEEEGEEIGENHDEQQQQPKQRIPFHIASAQHKEENKNPVIREYVIEKIRQGTFHTAIGIIGCGLVKGVVYSSLNCLIHMIQYFFGLYRMFRITLMTEVEPSSLTSTMIIWLEYTLQIPINCVSILWQHSILPVYKYTGISWVVNKSVSSVMNASSLSLCMQCVNVTQNMMMYAGIFLLVFYLILVHSYPQKSVNDESLRKTAFASNVTSRGLFANRLWFGTKRS